MGIIILIGRILFGLIFLGSGIAGHFMQADATAGYAESRGVKNAKTLVQVSGALIAAGARLPEILVDQGTADGFLDEQLRPWLLEDACTRAGIDLTLRMQEGYDHSYYFISSFMADHLAWHAERLKP